MKLQSAAPFGGSVLFQIAVTLAMAFGPGNHLQAQTTDPAGNGQSFNHAQPGLVMHHLLATSGAYPSPSSPSTDGVATVHLFAGTIPAYAQPSLQGQLYPIAGNEALFSLLGTNFGGDGLVNFGLPDLRGRFTVSTGTPHWGGPPMVLGQVFGNPIAQLTLATLPEHRHTLGDGNVRTSYAGSGEPTNLLSASLPLNYIIAVEGFYPTTLAFPMIGMIRAFAGSFVPAGWLPADGRLLNIAQNDTLFQVIGTIYGGDGITTFALPDLRGRVAVGYDWGAGLNLALGEYRGSPAIALGSAQLPSHSHTLSGGGSTNATGLSLPFSNLQPALAIKYLIALQGTFPSFESGSFNPQSPTRAEVIAFAGTNVPNGSAECAGQLLLISQNQSLYSILGTTYGGNGSTTFALPDLRGRVPVGVGNGFSVGQLVGTATSTLTINTMTMHTHEITYTIFENGFE